ncbi:MAG TPA: SAM-dependent methyltransferase [Clostridiaceae bacterium]|jgi:SAM-dependent methyltransferase|nr:SAM-dependent methyltransferase [Clostridiaceae bacterium]
MDKQAQQKLNMMLQGIAFRMTDEIDYFEELTGEFKSGVITFPLTCHLDNGKLKINFEGRSIETPPDKIPELITGFSGPYEKVNIYYKSRGEMLIIEADNKNVTMKTKALEEDRESIIKGHAEGGAISNRDYLIKPGKADKLLKAIGIMAQNGKIKNDMIRKYNQIDHFVELIEPMLKDLMKDRSELKVVDCACGKSYLSFVLNYYLREVMKINCRFTGIDISEGVIESSKEIAESLGYRNMNFITGDIRTLLYENEKGENVQPDLVISLHACDVATDYALAYGIRNRARGIIAVPCCHSELLNQYSYEPFEDMIKHGVFKARLADVLTDGLRCMILEAFGYAVSAVEYVSPLDTPKNLLIRATFTGRFNRKKYDKCLSMAEKLNADPMLINETRALSK